MITPAQHYYVSALITAIADCILLTVVYVKATDRILARRFFLYTYAIAHWSFLVYLCTSTNSYQWAYTLSQLCHMGGIFIPVTFLHFVITYTNHRSRWMSWILRISYGLTLGVFLILVFKPRFFIADVVPKLTFNYFPDPGPVFIFWNALFVILVSMSFLVLLIEGIKKTGKERKAAFLFLGANVLGYLGGIGCFFPVYNINFFPFPYGMWGVFFFTGVTTVAVTKYKLVNLEVVVKKTVVFTSLLAAVLAVFVGITVLTQELLSGGRYIGLILGSVVIILMFKPLEAFLVNLTDKYLFQKKYEYKGILKIFLEDVLRIHDLGQIVRGTKDLINNTLHPAKFSIYLVDTAKDKYVEYDEGSHHSIDPESALVTHLKDKRDLINLEIGNNLGRVVDEMKQLGMTIAIPLESRNRLLGLMLLGKKRSDEDYSQDDLDVLRDLSKAEAIAIDNAKVGMEVIKNKTAEQMAHLADGMSHQYNNYFGCMVSELDMKEIFVPELLQECEGLSSEGQIKKLKEIIHEMLESIAIVNAEAKRGGELAESVLNHTRADKVGFKVQNITKGLELGIRFVGLRRRDLYTIQINKSIPEDLPPTWSNMSSLQNMFQITIDNAYDAIKKRAESEPSHKGAIDIAMIHKKIENLIRIVVKDNGIGMKPRELEAVRAHVPYFTTKGSSGTKSGFGAGISFLAELVRIHDGRLDYESTYGEGASCIIDLPVRDNPPQKGRS